MKQPVHEQHIEFPRSGVPLGARLTLELLRTNRDLPQITRDAQGADSRKAQDIRDRVFFSKLRVGTADLPFADECDFDAQLRKPCPRPNSARRGGERGELRVALESPQAKREALARQRLRDTGDGGFFCGGASAAAGPRRTGRAGFRFFCLHAALVPRFEVAVKRRLW